MFSVFDPSISKKIKFSGRFFEVFFEDFEEFVYASHIFDDRQAFY
jgi:hypothetical protein